jgi:uncharacterized protein
MKITLTGASGFVGSRVLAKLLADGHQAHVLGRKRDPALPAGVAFSQWDATAEPDPASISDADAIIHLAGEPVGQRWTAEVKTRIRDSRGRGTTLLVSALRKLSRRPAVLVAASAIGIYGSRGDEVLTETSPAGQGFLAEVVRHWEAAALSAESAGIRVACLRLGVVLGKGGALAKMLPPFRLGIGGRIGSGHQWMSWIHLEDVVRMIVFALENAGLHGAVNTTAPNPVTNRQFTEDLASALHRPAIFPIPELALKLMFGEMSSVLLASQRVLPKAANAAGFRFQYPDLRPALVQILNS